MTTVLIVLAVLLCVVGAILVLDYAFGLGRLPGALVGLVLVASGCTLAFYVALTGGFTWLY